MERVCKECGSDISHKLLRRLFCNRSCSSSHLMKSGHLDMLTKAKLGKPRPDASARMKSNNPMNSVETREKVSSSLKSIGHKPVVRGGNGTGLTRHQKILLDGLRSRWPLYTFEAESPIRTISVRNHFSSENNIPNHYKADILCVTLSIVIEVDGGSHNSPIRRHKDKKKDRCLTLLGYDVIRIKNSEIDDSLPNCLDEFQKRIPC